MKSKLKVFSVAANGKYSSLGFEAIKYKLHW